MVLVDLPWLFKIASPRHLYQIQDVAEKLLRTDSDPNVSSYSKPHLLPHPLELLPRHLRDRTPIRLCLRPVLFVEAVTALVQGVDVGLALVLVESLGHAGLEGASVVCTARREQSSGEINVRFPWLLTTRQQCKDFFSQHILLTHVHAIEIIITRHGSI